MERAHLGNGWHLHTLEDQYLVLSKEDASYRKATGRDGIVKVYGEPGIERSVLIQRGVDEAGRSDAALAEIVAHEVVTGKKPKKRKKGDDVLVDAKGNVTVQLPSAQMNTKGNEVG